MKLISHCKKSSQGKMTLQKAQKEKRAISSSLVGVQLIFN